MTNNSVVSSFLPPAHRHQNCIRDALSAADEICEERGLRLTALRRRVLELIWAHHEPVGAYDLLDKLRGERERAAPPTVYRALDFLLEHGLIHRLESLNAFVGCAEPSRSHSGQFLICAKCKAVGEMDDDEIRGLVARKAKGLGFLVSGQTIEINGICPACAGGA